MTHRGATHGAYPRCAGRRAALCGPHVSVLRGQPTGVARSTRGAAFLVSPRTAVGAVPGAPNLRQGRSPRADQRSEHQRPGRCWDGRRAARACSPEPLTGHRGYGAHQPPPRAGIGAVPIRKSFAPTWRRAPSVRNPLPPGTPANTGSRRGGSDPNGERLSGKPSHAATATVWPSSSTRPVKPYPVDRCLPGAERVDRPGRRPVLRLRPPT